MNWLRKEEWPWWQTGLLLGLLNIATFYVSDYYLSVSTTFSRAAGMLVGLVAPEHVAANAYWQKVKPIVDWQFMLVIGIPIGAYLAARLSRNSVRVYRRITRDVGEPIWHEQGRALDAGNSRRHPRRFWRALGRRLHQRPCAQRRTAIGGQQLDFSRGDDAFGNDHGAFDF